MPTQHTTRTSSQWLRLFQSNAAPRDFGIEEGNITHEQLAAIQSSLQEFQLGETGEGLHLMRQAKIHAALTNDPDYPPALRLFIAEEIRHARELKAWMDSVNMPTVKHTWVDGTFRWIRHRAGLELSIAVLVSAEIIATIYYAALARATGSTVLARLCDRILRDEADHVRFQCERLAILRQHKSAWQLHWRAAAYALFFRLTLLIVWRRHRRALRAGGYPFAKFWSASITNMHHAMSIAQPSPLPKSSPIPAWLRARLASIWCALAGIAHLLRTQPNARIHAAATFLTIFAGLLCYVSLPQWCWLIAAIAAVWVAEALNTALELLADAVSRETHPLIGHAKDVAAGAVLLTSLGALAIGLCIFLPHLTQSLHWPALRALAHS